jgi:glycosyltransferase involved in cell wall biosynthesis
MLHCLVNLAQLDPPLNGGTSRVAREVVTGLAAAGDHTIKLSLLVSARFLPRFHEWLGFSEGYTVLPYIRYAPISFYLRLLRPTILVSPLFGPDPLPIGGRIPHVVSVPDTQALDRPEYFSARAVEKRTAVYRRARHATRIITLSSFARGRIADRLSVALDRIQVIELGSDGLTAPRDERMIADPYVYYPAHSWLHKRHDLLLSAMNLIWQARPELKLALSGGRSAGGRLSLAQAIPPDRLIDLGYVDDGDVATLYRDAEALLFTSDYEGFGMPVLEAMRAGCPVLAAPLTAIPEIAGDAALMVKDDANPAAWADAFLNRLPAQREALIARGRARAAIFMWERTRARWLEAILDVAGKAAG